MIYWKCKNIVILALKWYYSAVPCTYKRQREADKMLDAPSGYQVLSRGLEHTTNEAAYRKILGNIVKDAFDKLFELQDRGLLGWRRTGRRMDMFNTNIYPIRTHNGSYENISVYLVVRHSTPISVFLYLGSLEDAPCLNEADERVMDLYRKLCL